MSRYGNPSLKKRIRIILTHYNLSKNAPLRIMAHELLETFQIRQAVHPDSDEKSFALEAR
jgi:hypothetical protein